MMAMPAAFDRYLALVALRSLLFTALGLCALLSLFGFVSELSLVGHGGFDTVDALFCALLEAPARLLQVAPVSMLLACLLGLGAMARHSELVALRSLGLSRLRIMLPAMLLALPAGLLLLALSQFVIPGGQQAARQLRVAAISGGTAGARGEEFWARGPDAFLEVGSFGDRAEPQHVAVYAFEPDGTLREALFASWATIENNGTWRLHDVVRHVEHDGELRAGRVAVLSWPSFLTRRELRFLATPPADVSATGLLQHIHLLHRRSESAIRYERELWSRIAVPVSMAGLALAAAPLLFGAPRGRSAGARLGGGIAIAGGYTLAQEIANRVGVLLELPPPVPALLPPVLLLALTVWLLVAEPG